MAPSFVVRRKRSRSPPGGFDSARCTRPCPMVEMEGKGGVAPSVPDDTLHRKSPWSPQREFDSARCSRTRPMVEMEHAEKSEAERALAPPDGMLHWKRPRSPQRGFDSPRGKRTPPVAEMEQSRKRKAGMAVALPDDMLLEVFRRLPPLRDVVRCAAVCRRWRRLISSADAACLPAPPRHFGFFRNYGPSPLPPFVPTAGVALDIGFLPVPPACGALLIDLRNRRLLLRELGAGHARVLRLLVCSPLEKTFVRVPSLYIAGHRVACCVLVPGEGAAFRVVVVLFGTDPNHFEILVYSSPSSAWEVATGPINRGLVVHPGPSVVIGDVAYKLQIKEKYIMAVDAARLTLSAVPLPDTGMQLYVGNHWIGKTGDGRLCFFAIREQLTLVQWVLEASGKWSQQQPVDLRALMHPALVGDLANMKLSAKMSDQLRGCKLVSFAAFCEGTGTLFFIMADWVVAIDPRTRMLRRLWRNTDQSRPLGDVYPCEMMQWPPALKNPGEAL
ncbi:hypothetical protein U9M48_010433 [Paspalum notatum var. saurae]|uniref:F-box domain-containing protein n=1 Tax=Paspalum notatum var. saurae TaxID=547442 RepID=A0AAQ3STJ7_PASNO